MDKLNKLLEEYPNWKWDLDSLKFLRGFIKWLVENNKIDLEWTEYSYYFKIKDKSYYSNDVPTENIIIMLLAISDNPIDFLIEILK